MKKIAFLVLSFLFVISNFSYAQGCMDDEGGDDEGIKVFGFVQAQGEHNFLGEKSNGESLDESSFYFKRARVGVRGTIPYDFSYYVVAEMAPVAGGPGLCDAFISYNRFGPYLKVAFGQFKSPFGQEQLLGCHKIPTIERSLVSNDLAGPMRDIGVMISGGTDSLSILGSTTKNLFGYSFAVMNGTGLNVLDNNRKKDLIGRLTFHPVEFLTLGASYRMGKHPQETSDDDSERSRFGFDAEVNFKGFRVMGEYISGSDVGSYTTGGGCGGPIEVHEGSLDRSGYSAQVMYKTPWNVEPVIKYESYDINTAKESIDDIQNVITFGANYFFNEWTRLQVNYLYKAEETGNVEVPNDALLVQLQVVF